VETEDGDDDNGVNASQLLGTSLFDRPPVATTRRIVEKAKATGDRRSEG